MSIQSEIDRIKAAKADAKAALIERGVDPGDATIDEYGNQIRAIPTGVTSFKGRSGAVEPQAGDYTAEQVGARPNNWVPTAADIGESSGTDYGTYRPRGMAFFAQEPASVPNGCIACICE